MIQFIFIAGLVGLAAYIVWMLARGRNGPTADGITDGAPDRPKQRFRPYASPPPEQPEILPPDAAEADAAPLDDAYAALRPFERVATACAILDISPDGREAMALHDGNAITIYDVCSGKAVKTWRDICPPEWIGHLGEDACFSCAGRRLFWGWSEDDRHLNILIDLEKGEVTRIYDTADGEQAIMSAAMSADGRFVFATACYSKEHPVFDLDRARAVGEDEGGGGGFGDYVLEPGTILPEIALTPDGRYGAFEIGDGDVQVIVRGDEPEDFSDLPTWAWPNYDEHMRVSGDDVADRLAFSDDGAFLLVLERDGGMILADLEAEDYRLLKPFGDSLGDAPVCLALTWVRGRQAAIVEILEPTPRLIRIDLDAGEIDAEWPVTADMLQRLRVSPTGELALINCPGGVIRVTPLSE